MKLRKNKMQLAEARQYMTEAELAELETIKPIFWKIDGGCELYESRSRTQNRIIAKIYVYPGVSISYNEIDFTALKSYYRIG